MAKKPPAPPVKRTYISQSEIPRHSLEEALKVAIGVNDNFNGDGIPHELATAMGISPTSSIWQSLTGSAVAFGLTEGAYNASSIKLTPLAKRIVSVVEDGDDIAAKREAAVLPKILRAFYEKYNKGKFPAELIAKNVLISLGVPRERADEAYNVAKASGEFSGIITQTKAGPYVALSYSRKLGVVSQVSDAPVAVESTSLDTEEAPPVVLEPRVSAVSTSTRVFITHGKNRAMVDQLREILTFGKFVPVVAVEHQTVSKPLPDKVMDEMRSCFAGVIHIESELELMDANGIKHQKINDNVLIEIGAAMALYSGKFVLLVKKGIQLPSNLQGLYCCYYDGDKLDYEATMKLLKAFNDFR